MRITYVIISFFFVIICNAQTNNLNQIRQSYLKSAESEENIDKLIITCKKYKSKNNAIINAYKTVADLMLLKYEYNPLYKLTLFTDYSVRLDSIVINNFNNIEIRFLRYCVQKQTPRILGYNDNLEPDYQFILQNIGVQPKELQEYIRSTLESL
tara:strand:+ start:875 stop:1336 length:462 start_codon:yes stop_codon:yes gene_type:complete